MISSKFHTWEQEKTSLWRKYTNKLKLSRSLSKHPILDLISVETIWIVSDRGMSDNISYYG